MFLRILLAGFGGFSNFLADRLPFVILILLDGIHQGLALIFGEFSIMHILVPVLLHRAFSASGESLRDLSPAVSRVAHLLQPLLLGGGPRSVRPALLGRWRRRRSIILGGYICSRSRGRSKSS